MTTRPSESVRRTGILWVRLAQPVNFGHDEHDPVDLMVGRPEKRAALEEAWSPAASPVSAAGATEDQHLVLTVCGNGLGTPPCSSRTLKQVLDTRDWSRFITVGTTDTITTRGLAKEAKAILTSAC